jgi:hypothetical protein
VITAEKGDTRHLMTHHVPRPSVDLDAVAVHHRTAEETRTPLTLWFAVADVPVLIAEVRSGRSLLAVVRADYADLLAAAQATLAADSDGETDPLWYLRDELTAQLEPRDVR